MLKTPKDQSVNHAFNIMLGDGKLEIFKLSGKARNTACFIQLVMTSLLGRAVPSAAPCELHLSTKSVPQIKGLFYRET